MTNNILKALEASNAQLQKQGVNTTPPAATVEKIGSSQYDEGLTPGYNPNEYRAYNQPWQDKLGNGLVNMGTSAFTSALQSTVGLVFGATEALVTGKGSAIWDNDVTKANSIITEAARESYPFYYSEAEQNASTLGSMGYQNFWFDKAMSGAGYTVGSLVAGMGYAKVFNMGKTAQLTKLATDANKLEGVVGGLEGAAATHTKWNLAKEIGLGLTLANGESSLEAFETAKATEDFYLKARELGLAGDDAYKQYASLTDAQIEEYKTDAGNSNYLVNLAITGSTNFLLLRKFINPGSKETLKTYNNIGKKTLADGTVEYFDKVAAQKGAAYFNLGKKFMSGVIPESIQEGSQYASNIAAQEFVKNYHIENKDWFESVVSGIGEGISRTLSEKEGLQSILLGGIIGGPFGMKGARGERLATNANTQKLIDVINKDPNFLDANPKVKDFLAAVQASEKAENYIADGDIFEAKNKTAHALNTYVKSLIDAGAIEQFTTRLTSLKDIEQQEFEQYFGQGTVKEDLDKVLNQVEKLVKLNDNITTLYGISGGTEEERSYNKKLRDRFFFSASTINNMDARESSIEASLLELEGKNDLYDINELRKELHRDRKKEVPETLQGEDYNKYLANLKTITEDAYKTKLDKYTEDYPVESADALKYLGDLNRLTVKRKDFVTYYNALNNKEEADKLMKAEADALEEFINLAQNEEARKQAEADAVKESQLDPSLINDVFKKDVNASNKITSKDDGTELDLSSLDDAALRGLRDDYTTARDLFGEDNFNYSEALEAIERELDLRDGVITADSLKEQLANIKSETELAALVEEARKNGFIADQEKLKNITRALIEEQKRKDALTNTQNNAFSKFKDIQEFTRTFILYSGDTQEEKNNNKRKAQEKLDYLLNNISAFSNDTRVSLTEEEESIIANFGIKVTPNENAGNLSKFDEQDQNPILFSKASPIKIEITYEGVPIAGIPYYAGFADKNGVSIDPTLMSYTEWVDLFKPVKYKSNEENFELYKDAYEKARDFFVFVNEALGPQGQLTSKTEIIFNSTEFLKLLAPTISSGSFDINTPQNAKSLIEEYYPLFDDDTSDFSYSYLLIDTRELTNGVIKSANNNHIDPVTLETREKYKDAIKALQERKTQGKINAKHLLQRYVILVEHPRGTITLLGDDARYEWMPLIPAKYEVSDLINKLKELKEAYVNKVIGADGYAMNNKAAATILNSEIFFSLESGWDVGLFLNESFTEFSLKFTYGETSVFANIKLNELENNLTPEFFLKTLNESLATPRNQNVKQQINGENADKVISQITGKEPISEDNFRIQVDKKIENVSANDILESFYSILSPNIKKNQSIIINHSAPKIPSTLPLETKPVTAPTFTTTPIANSAELKEIIIAIKDKIKASNNPNIKAQDPGAKEAFIRVGTTLGVKEDSLNSFYNGLAPLGGTTLIDSLDVILKYLDGNTVSVIQKAIIQNNLLSLLVKTALSTPETQPSASTTDTKETILQKKEEKLANVKPVYHHTKVAPQNFNFGSFQRGKDQISQFGNGLNASSNTTSFLVNRYGKPIEGEVNDSDFVKIDASKTEKEVYEELKKQGYTFSEEHNTDDILANVPGAAMELFTDFQKSNPNVKGVQVNNHIIGNTKVAPFYVIYDAKAFYGQNELTKKIEQEINEELAALKPTQTPTVDLEAKKADIEKRRKEELKNTFSERILGYYKDSGYLKSKRANPNDIVAKRQDYFNFDRNGEVATKANQFNEINDKYDAEYIDDAELAALGTDTKTNPTPLPKTRVDPRDGGTIDPFSHVNSSGEQRSIERNLQEAFSYLKEVFGSSISAEEFKGLEENLAKGKVRYGNFKDALIRLSRFSPEGTEYHEAFHGVFRMFLTDSEIEYYTALGKETLYQELKDKGISITQTFKEFKKDFFLKNPGKIINDTDLKNLMIEEFLADKYKAWKLAKVKVKKTGIAGLLQSLWEKLQRALNIFTESPAVDSIEGLFEQIDRGSFKNKTAVVNKFKNTVLPADISLYAGTKEDPEDGRRYPRFLNEHVANQLISTVVARVNQMRKENLKISFDTLIEKALNELHLNFALNDTRYDNLIDSKNEKAIDLYYDLGHVLNKESTANREEVKGEKNVYKITDFSPREAIKEAAKTILKKFNFNIDKALIENEVSEEELETGETTTNELSPERNRDLNQENLGGYKNLSKKLRAYISLTTYSTNLNDFFKVQGVFSEDHNITLAVDVKRVYNGIAKATQNSLTSKEIMTKLIHYRNVSSESKRVIDKLLKDLNFPIESFLATGEYNEIDLNPDTIDIYHAFVKGFNLHSFDHMFTEYDFDLGVTRGYFSNRKGSDNEQHSKWYNIYSKLRSTWGATKEDRIKYVQSNIVPKLEKARQSIIIDTKVTLTEEALNTRLSALKEGLGNVGITLSDGLLKYFILNNSNYTNKSPEQISYVETFKYNMIESQVYFETTIEELISHLIKDANPFIRNEVIKKEKRKERETKLLEEGVDEKEAAEKSIETGLVSRILTLAKNNATFDETLSPNSYLNAEYKAIYSLQKPTADSIIALAIAKGREDLLPLNYKSDPYFKEHRLLNNPIFKNIKKYLKVLREDGGRVRFLKYENNTFKTDPFKQTEEGVSFGSYKGRELALAEYSHYLNKKFDSLAGETTTIVRPVILDIMENASSLNLIPLPVVDSFTYNTETNSAGLTDTFKDAIVTEVKREWEKIQRVKAEGLDPSTRKEGYNWGASEENIANLRGYNFWHFKPLLTFNNSSLAKDLANSTEFEDFQDALLEQIDAFYNDQLTQHLEQLVKTGILRKNYTDSGKKVTYANVLLDTRYGSRMVKPQGKNWIFEEETKRKSTLKQMAGDNMTSPFTSNYVVHNIAQVFFSNYLNRLSYNQLIKGDPSEGMANPIDWFKRSKGRNGSGDSLYSELMPVTRYAIIGKRNTSGKLEDPNKLFKVTNRLLDPNNPKDMQEYNDLITTIQTDPALTEAEKNKALKDLQNKGKVEITDGQGYLSATAYRNYLHGLGKLNKETWAIYNKIIAGEKISPKENTLLIKQGVVGNSLKVVYYDGVRFLKLSVQLLSKEEVSVEIDGVWQSRPGKEAKFAMLNQMEEHSIDLVVPPSVTKTLKENAIELNDDDSFTVDNPTKQINIISNLFGRLQQENPSNKTTSILPTQNENLIEAEQNVDQTIVYPSDLNINTVGQLLDKFRQVKGQKAEREYVSVKNVIFSLQKGTTTPELGRLAKLMKEALLRTGATGQLLEFFETDENGIPAYDFANMPHTQSKFEALYNAHFNNVFKQRVAGYKTTLQSAFGHKLMYYETNGVETILNSAEFNDNPKKYLQEYKEGKLKVRELSYNKVRYNEKGEEIGLYTEFVMSAHFAEQFNLKPGDIIPDSIAYMFGVRIPSQDKHSAVSLKLVDILPNYMGSNAVFPHELIKIMGHDFDIDSLYIHRPAHYVNKKGQIKVFGNTEESAYEQYLTHYKEDSFVKLIKEELVNSELEEGITFSKERVYTLEILQKLYKAKEILQEAKESASTPEELDELTNDIAEAKLETSNYKEHLKALEDYLLTKALETLGLPSTEEAFIKETKKSGELNPSVLSNEMLTAKIALHTNKSVKEIITTPASLIAIEKALDKLATLKGLTSHEELNAIYDVNSLSSLMEALASNRAGEESIGASVNASQVFTRLSSYGITIGEKFSYLLPIIDNYISGGYLNNTTQDNIRIMDILSTITTAMTDNPKWGFVNKLGLSLQVLAAVSNLVSLGYSFETSIFLVNQDYLKKHIEAIEAKSNNLRAPGERSVDLNKMLQRTLTELAEEIKKIDPKFDPKRFGNTFTTEELEEGLKVKDREGEERLQYLLTNYNALNFYDQFEPITNTFSKVGSIMKITKGTGASFGEEDAFFKTLNDLGGEFVKNSKGEWKLVTKKSNKIMPGILKVFTEHALTIKNLAILADKKDITKNVAIRRTSLFEKTLKGSLATFKARIFNRVAKENALSKNLLSFLVLRAYEKQERETLFSISNVTQTLYKLNEDQQTLRDEYLTLSEKYPDLVGNSVALFSIEFNDPTKNGFSSNTYTTTKGSPEFEERISNDFENLYNHQQTRPFIIKLFNYLIAKDALQFKNQSFINIMPPTIFKRYSKASKKVQELLKKNSSPEEFMKLFDKTENAVIDEYMELHVRNPETFYDIVTPHETLTEKNLPLTIGKDTEGNTTFTIDLFKGMEVSDFKNDLYSLTEALTNTGEDFSMEDLVSKLKKETSEKRSEIFKTNLEAIANFPELFIISSYEDKQQNETKFRLRILFKDGIRLPKTETRKATIAVLTNAENSTMTKQGPVFTAAERNSLGLKQGTKATYTLKDFVGNKFNKVTPFGMGLAQAETVTQEKLMPQILEEDGESSIFETLTNKIFKPAPTVTKTTQPSTSVKPGVQELFDSNPELANAVYEALGVKDYNGITVELGRSKVLERGKVQNIIVKYNGKPIIGENKESGLGEMNVMIQSRDAFVGMIRIPTELQGKGLSKYIYQATANLIGVPIINSKERGESQTESGGYVWKNKTSFQPNQITPQQKQQAQQKFQEYVDTTGKQDIEGFKNFVTQSSTSNLPGPETKINIYAGTGENAELSNFANRPTTYNTVYVEGLFMTPEGAFQAAKINYTENLTDKEKIDNSIIFEKLKSATGSQAKSLGKTIKGLNQKAWDEESSDAMYDILLDSFRQNPDALATLLATGNAELTHTQDKGKWGTEFPKLLMEVREELKATQPSSITTIIENKKKEGEAKLGLIEPDLLPKRSILMQELINSLVTEKGGSPLKYVGEVNKLTDEQLIEEWNKRCNTL